MFRDGDERRIPLRLPREGGGQPVDSQAEAFTDLDEALTRLEALDPRQGQVVEQRYFGGLSLEEIGEALGVSLATVKRELRFAQAWLAADLGATGAASRKST